MTTEKWEIGNIENSPIDNSPIGGTTPAAGAFTTLKQTTGKALGAIPISDATGAYTLTASTGTGAPVRATSPTLVTPLLGTPTSGVLTNCTGLPISTGVAGLGANVATWLATPSSANLRAAVSDETGTGLAVFATSPTLVTPVLGTPASGDLQNCTMSVAPAIGGTTPAAGTFTTLIGRLMSPLSKTASYSVLTTDFGKSLRFAHASTNGTMTLPSVGASEDGARLTFIKTGAARLVIDASDSDLIYDSSAGGTIYSDSTYATITLEYVDGITAWVIVSAVGTWTTT